MSSRPTKIIVAVLAGLLVSAGADVGLRATARARVAAVLEALPGLRVAGMDVAPFAGRLTLHDVGWRGARARLTIGEMQLPLPGPGFAIAQAAADPAAPAVPPAGGTIQAEDVAIHVGAATIRIKRIDLAGTKLTDADLKALLDDKAPDGLEARVRKLSATAIVIPEIAIDDPTGGAERHAIVKKVLLAGVTDGKASAFSAADTSVALTSGEDAVNGTTGGIEAANVDLAQLARVLVAKRTDAAEAIRPLFDKLQIDAPKLANITRGAGISARRIAATGVGARPLDESLAAASTVAAQAGSSAAANALLLDDLTQSVSLQSLDVEDAAAQSKSADEDTRIAATHLGVRDVGARGIGAVEVAGFKLEGAYVRLAVGNARIGPVPVPAKKAPGETRPPARPAQVDLGQIEVDVTPRDKPPSQALRFRIERAAVAQGGGPTAIPATGSATVDKLTFEAAPDGATSALYQMGYRGVNLSATLSSTYDADSQELMIRKLAVNEPAMGSAEVELRLAGVSQDLLSPDAETSQAAAIGVIAKSIDLKLANAGFAEKALDLMARRDGRSVDAERAYYVELFSADLPGLLGDRPGLKAIGAALAKFVAAPKSLHIAIASKDGLGVGTIGMLGDPAGLIDSLDIKASANE